MYFLLCLYCGVSLLCNTVTYSYSMCYSNLLLQYAKFLGAVAALEAGTGSVQSVRCRWTLSSRDLPADASLDSWLR